jgi:hypothetical protein
MINGLCGFSINKAINLIPPNRYLIHKQLNSSKKSENEVLGQKMPFLDGHYLKPGKHHREFYDKWNQQELRIAEFWWWTTKETCGMSSARF